jgi:hypothetical protein
MQVARAVLQQQPRYQGVAAADSGSVDVAGPERSGASWFLRHGQEVCVAVHVQQLLSGVLVTRVAAMAVWPDASNSHV